MRGMRKILIVYSTTDGHTPKICHFICDLLQAKGHQVSVCDIKESPSDLDGYDQVVIGAAIRYGKHHPSVYAFIKSAADYLNRTPSAFFSVNLVARKPAKQTPETNPYVRKFLRQIPWRPSSAAVFAGVLNYSMYSFWDKHMIRLIMRITKGPTALDTHIEYTDWEQVRLFAEAVSQA